MIPARLDVDIAVPARDVHLQLTPRPGRITAVIGPNGAGKSTLLGAIGGAVGAKGAVHLDGREVLGLAPHRRGVSHLRQDPVLFAHMSILENVAFGPRAAGTGRAAARERAHGLLADVGVGELAHRRPHEVSGGQAQRVAIARALAADPSLLLLDEPFAALDAEAATHLRALCARMLEDRTVLLVTHDILDVLAMAHDVLVLEAGRIAQHGTREEVLARPLTAFAAHLLGKELRRGVVEHVDGPRASLRLADDERGAGRLVVGTAGEGIAPGESALVLVDPAHVRLSLPASGETADDVDPAAHTVEVAALDRVGTGILVRGGGLAAQIPPERVLADGIGVGSTVRMLPDPARCAIYPGRDEHRT